MKLVLAYSGGLDTLVALPWLKENYDCEVIAMLADVGQGEDLVAAAEKALSIGACQAFVEDLRTEFVRDYFFSLAPSRRPLRRKVPPRYFASASGHRSSPSRDR